MISPRSRWAVGCAGAGLVAGLALGLTGFAHAANPSPSPSPFARTGGPGFGHHFGAPFGHRFGHRDGWRGLVTSVSADALTVRTLRGTQTIALNSNTVYYQGQDKSSKSAVKSGELVMVRLVDPRASAPVAAVVTVVPAHLAGWVTSIS